MNTMFDEYIDQARAGWENVGLAVAVVKGEEILYARGFGRCQADQASRVDPDTLFQVGSTTKAFSAMALGMLADDGKIDWDDAVVEHLPDLQLKDPCLTPRVTIRDTLAHRSGIADDSCYPFLGIMSSDDTVGQLRYITPRAAFRDSFCYSNLMYAVAGKVIEAASGMSWSAFMQERMLAPLDMKRSGATLRGFWNAPDIAATFLGSAPAAGVGMHKALDANVAMPHGWDDNGNATVLPWRSYDNAAAAGALVSSAMDMANWLILNLKGGEFQGRRLIREDTLRELHATQNLRIDCDHFPFRQTGETYALGWRRAAYRGSSFLAHSGGIIGFPAYMAILPEHSIGIVVLSNGSRAARERLGVHKSGLHKAIVFGVVDRLLGVHSCDWNSEFLQRALVAERELEQQQEHLQRARLRSVPPSLALASYAGDYEDVEKHSGRVHVCCDSDALRLRFAGQGAYAARLRHWHGDMFRLHSEAGVADVIGPQFPRFAIDAHGKVVSMTAFDATFQKMTSEPCK